MNKKKKISIPIIMYLVAFFILLSVMCHPEGFKDSQSTGYYDSFHIWIEIKSQNEECFCYEEVKSYLTDVQFPERNLIMTFNFPESTTDIELIEDWLKVSNNMQGTLDLSIKDYFDKNTKQLSLEFAMPEFTVLSGEKWSLGFKARIKHEESKKDEFSIGVELFFPKATANGSGKLLSSSGFFQIILPPHYAILNFKINSSSKDDRFILIPTNQGCARVFFIHFPNPDSTDSSEYNTIDMSMTFRENQGGADLYPILDEISLWSDLHVFEILKDQKSSIQIEMTINASDGKSVTKVLSPLIYVFEKTPVEYDTFSAVIEGGIPLKIVTFEEEPHRLIEYLCTESGSPIVQPGESVRIHIEFQYSNKRIFESGKVHNTDPFGLLLLGSMNFIEYQLCLPENSEIRSLYPSSCQREKNQITWKWSRNDDDEIVYFGTSFVKYEKIPADTLLLTFPSLFFLIFAYIFITYIFLTRVEHRYEIILALISFSFVIYQQLHKELPFGNIDCLYSDLERTLAFTSWWIPGTILVLCVLIVFWDFFNNRDRNRRKKYCKKISFRYFTHYE